jgi:hypothetical protein
MAALHDVGRFEQPLAAARRDEQAEDGRIDAHHHREAVVAGDRHEEVGDLVRQREPAKTFRRRHDGGDRAVERELDQHAGGRRHGPGDRVEE